MIDVEELARARAQAESERGADPQPWQDPHRDFIYVETGPKLADAINHLDWELKQAELAHEDNGLFRLEIALARQYVRLAYHHAREAMLARERGRKMQFDESLPADPARVDPLDLWPVAHDLHAGDES